MQKALKEVPRTISSARASLKRDAEGVSKCITVRPIAPNMGAMQEVNLEMDQLADLIVDRLKPRFRSQTDQQLADALKIGRSTVTSWRRRGSIPDIYVRMSMTDSFVPLGLSEEIWTATEAAAFRLGMMRLIKGFGGKVADYPGFMQKSGFLAAQLYSSVQEALSDLQAEMSTREIEDAAQCANLMVYEEFFAPR